jgi:phage terminase Nu1 subunit (DNA packaging protein)
MKDEISTAELTQLTKVPRRTLARWNSDGIISSTTRGHWNTAETIAAIIRHLRTQSVSTNTKADLLKETIRAKRLANDTTDKTVISRSDCEDGWAALAGLVVSTLESMPAQLAPRIVLCETVPEMREALKREVRSIRQQLADEVQALTNGIRSNGRSRH